MYSYYPDELIEEIRLRNDIVDVVSEYVKLDRKGSNNFGLCPFHKEKTPSFCVSETKQIFNCFGCGKGGNVIQFVMLSENLDFVEAVKHLAERAKIDLPESDDKEDKQKASLKKELQKINTETARFYYSNLTSENGKAAREYLEKRGLKENNIKKFGLGYAGAEWDSLFKFLLEKGFKQDVIEQSGLILKNKNGGFYDRFRNRLMFPIFDVRGIVIAFGGRVLDDSLPKYMNSPETPVYHKGKNLYALNLAKNSGDNRIIVVEGYMDVISLHINGISNAVASLGTALTESQGRLLKKYAEEIIISYDADTAGQAATMRGLDLLHQIGCNVKVLVIPEGKDPDDFIRKNGPQKFRDLVDRSVSLLEYKAGMLKSKIDTKTTEGKIKFLNKVADMLSAIDNNLEREMYIKSLSRQYDISEEAMYAEIYKRTRPRTNYRKAVAKVLPEGNESEKATDNQPKEIRHLGRMLISLICIDNSVYKRLKEEIDIDLFTNAADKKTAELVFERIDSGRGIVPAELLGLQHEADTGEYAGIIQNECNCESNVKAAKDIIKRLVVYNMDKRKTEILDKLRDSGTLPKDETENLKNELNSLILKRKNL